MGDGSVVCRRGGERLGSSVGRRGRGGPSSAVAVGDGTSAMVLEVGGGGDG